MVEIGLEVKGENELYTCMSLTCTVLFSVY